jgi:hypothetical protein
MDTRDTMARERDWKRLDDYLAACADHARKHQSQGLPPCALVAPHEIDNVREYVRQLQQRCVEYAGMLGAAHWSIQRANNSDGPIEAKGGE